jgi:hypothetical protein
MRRFTMGNGIAITGIAVFLLSGVAFGQISVPHDAAATIRRLQRGDRLLGTSFRTIRVILNHRANYCLVHAVHGPTLAGPLDLL